MMFIAILVAGFVTGLVGLAFRRILGWPSTFGGAMKWGYGLLAVSLLYSALPHAIGSLGEASPGLALPGVSVGDAFPALLVVGLAVLGYVGWTRGEASREEGARRDERAAQQPRHRDLPQAPARARADGSFAERTPGAGHDPLFDDAP